MTERQEELTKEADTLRARVTEALLAKGIRVTPYQFGCGSLLLERGAENCSVEIYGRSYYSNSKSGVSVTYEAASPHAPIWREGLRRKRLTRATAAEHNVGKIVSDLIAVLDLKDRQAEQRRTSEILGGFPGHGASNPETFNMKDKVTSIIISVVENGYLVNPHTIKFGPCSDVQGPLYVYNNLDDLQRQLPALLGAEDEKHPAKPPKGDPQYLNIDINGRKFFRVEGFISYQDIVDLAETSWGPNALHTVTYSRGRHYQGTLPNSGTVCWGESIPVSEGLLIGATVTDAA